MEHSDARVVQDEPKAVETLPGDGDFKFNDEFFLEAEDRKRLQETFPLVAFAFHTPRASELFAEYDRKAKAAKSGFQRFGIGAVILALLALLLAAADPVLLAPAVNSKLMPELYSQGIALLAAIFGVLAILIAWAGMGLGKRRREWLKNRLIGERLRQWQGQYVCSHIPEILAGAHTPGALRDYIAARDTSFAKFQKDHVTNVGARLPSVLGLDRSNSPPLWLDYEFERSIQTSLAATARNAQPEQLDVVEEQLFDAYDEIRFRGQVDFTEYMRSAGRLRSHPRTQHRFLSVASYVCITSILVLDISVIVGVLVPVEPLKGPLVHFLAIAAALIALALRVLQDGLRPDVHVTRLDGYLEEISRARQRFRVATTTSEKLAEMRVLEEAAAREMIGFLRAAASARYVL